MVSGDSAENDYRAAQERRDVGDDLPGDWTQQRAVHPRLVVDFRLLYDVAKILDARGELPVMGPGSSCNVVIGRTDLGLVIE